MSKKTVLATIGLAGFWMFFCSYAFIDPLNPPVLASAGIEVAHHHAIAHTSAIVTAIVYFALSARREINLRRLFLMSAVLVFVGFVLVLLCKQLGSTMAYICGSALPAALLGVYAALMCFAWVDVIDRFDAPQRLCALALSSILCAVLMLFARMISSSTELLVWLMEIASGLICYFGFFKDRPTSCAGADAVSAGQDTRLPLNPRLPQASLVRSHRFIVFMTLSLFLVGNALIRQVFNVSGMPSHEVESWYQAVLNIALCGIALAWALAFRGRRGEASFPVEFFALVYIVALYIVALFSNENPFLCDIIILPTRPHCLVLLLALTIDIARERNWSTRYASPLFLIAASGSRAIGSFTGIAWESAATLPSISILALVSALILTAGMGYALMLPGHQDSEQAHAVAGGTAIQGGEVTERPPKGDATGEVSEFFEELKRTYELSDREVQVAQLLSQGDSRKKMAETLILSVNSVQTYTKSLYRKLGVHSRQEVIDLVRQGRSGLNHATSNDNNADGGAGPGVTTL